MRGDKLFNKRFEKGILFGLILFALLLSACGGGDSSNNVISNEPDTQPVESQPSETPKPTKVPTPVIVPFQNWSTGAKMNVPRSEMPAVVLDGKIYTIGGLGQYDENFLSPPEDEVVVEVYDPEIDQWTRLADLPAGRNHLSATAYDGAIYVFGGWEVQTWNNMDTAWKYDVELDQWEELANLPAPSGAGTAVTLGDYIYVIGGQPVGTNLFRYDPQEDNWEIMASMSEKREHFQSVTMDGKIWAMGGRWDEYINLASVEFYDPETDTWTMWGKMNVSRGGFGAAVYKDKIIVLGGEEISLSPGITLDNIFVFHSEVDRWFYTGLLPDKLHGVPAAVVGENLYVVGGSNVAAQSQVTGDVYIHSLDILE